MQLIDIATASRERFFFFIAKCNETYRFGHDLAIYREVISSHRTKPSLDLLLSDENFLFNIFRTLEEWNMNQRGARMTALDNFIKSVVYLRSDLIRLYEYKLYEDIDDDLATIKDFLEKIFHNLKVMESKRKIVGVSKILHFLIPDLIMPIDSKFTMTAFYGYNKYSHSVNNEFKTFWDIFERTFEISERLELSPNDVDGKLWNTTVPKLIDNAIIGLLKCKKEDLATLL